MFKLFGRKTDDDINYDLEISPIPAVPVEVDYSEFQELSINECFAVILERLDEIEAKIDKIK
tara:strand:+ start:106 stop:291 length:186 start_codon:yes stop_codon:yes gene_type:complete